ncbi:hypothetical protein J6590_102650 [Homalodisca vitripennis]|nr:hypothetical protein J6590_102650 [Homalodisca vitripennis]
MECELFEEERRDLRQVAVAQAQVSTPDLRRREEERGEGVEEYGPLSLNLARPSSSRTPRHPSRGPASLTTSLLSLPQAVTRSVRLVVFACLSAVLFEDE